MYLPAGLLDAVGNSMSGAFILDGIQQGGRHEQGFFLLHHISGKYQQEAPSLKQCAMRLRKTDFLSNPERRIVGLFVMFSGVGVTARPLPV